MNYHPHVNLHKYSICYGSECKTLSLHRFINCNSLVEYLWKVYVVTKKMYSLHLTSACNESGQVILHTDKVFLKVATKKMYPWSILILVQP